MSTPTNVFVTGATRGLGRALAHEFAKRGHRVFAGVRKFAGLDELPFESPAIVPIPIDIANDDAVARAAQTIQAHCTSLDVLVNCAGRLGDIETPVDGPLNFDDILATINTNALGPLRVTHAVLGLLKRGRLRSIVDISSEAGSIGQCWRSAWYGYCMSKAALNMQSVITYNRLREDGFSVKLIHPGYLKTYMHGHKNLKADYEPEEVAGLICDEALHPRPEESDKVPFFDNKLQPLPW